MKKLLAVSLLAIFFSAHATEMTTQQTDPAAVDSPNRIKELADNLIAWSAGYCKAQAEKRGIDFNVCFTQMTNIAIEKIQKEATQAPAR